MSFGDGDLRTKVMELEVENRRLERLVMVPTEYGVELLSVNEKLKSLIRYALYCMEEPISSHNEIRRRALELGIKVGE